jgi:hypothetical protein
MLIMVSSEASIGQPENKRGERANKDKDNDPWHSPNAMKLP